MKWMLKTSSVRVATAQKDRVYRSIEEAPPELRDKIRKVLGGPNVETILIANQEAYDQIAERLRDLAPEMPPSRRRSFRLRPGAGGRVPASWRIALAIGLSGISVLSLIWFLLIQTGKW